MSTTLYTDSIDNVERADHDRYGLTLLAERVEFDHDEFGAVIPIATADEFRKFIARWTWNDPNGTFNVEGIAEGDGALKYTDTEGNAWTWTVAGMSNGQPVYRITGFGQWFI
ncbi:hypothetical protein SEA_YEET_228 [Mycobacterium phage Yeet]|nr:hypothetical protein SEA_EJIMIX_225 [Mycobacterium phage Ejimix]AXQ52460.1 hypothetical protein SEA_ERICMILLARD_231 [Mycobacterium phage EricMillard]AXQ62631.1 hypothetical protein SEA_ZELINK_227 [Mycobacterium phage Zelink]QBI97677.1 hypothetical protein SEA_HUGHESYANG_236 [Mycobacterium phage Hughesyang]QBI99853.1 hypothetical protein SEA_THREERNGTARJAY_233 [Mycobacterium phage ThreeRngTarjay]QBJ00177.1 hypothetical protein SEA_PHOEBUS_232 [Mycobacterium phage Phoebus]QCO93914.1 hypothet